MHKRSGDDLLITDWVQIENALSGWKANKLPYTLDVVIKAIHNKLESVDITISPYYCLTNAGTSHEDETPV